MPFWGGRRSTTSRDGREAEPTFGRRRRRRLRDHRPSRDVTSAAGSAGQPIRGWFARPPPVAPTRPRRRLVEYIGYGGGRWRSRIDWLACGRRPATRTWSWTPAGRASCAGSRGDTPDHRGAPAHPASTRASLTRGIADPRTATTTDALVHRRRRCAVEAGAPTTRRSTADAGSSSPAAARAAGSRVRACAGLPGAQSAPTRDRRPVPGRHPARRGPVATSPMPTPYRAASTRVPSASPAVTAASRDAGVRRAVSLLAMDVNVLAARRRARRRACSVGLHRTRSARASTVVRGLRPTTPARRYDQTSGRSNGARPPVELRPGGRAVAAFLDRHAMGPRALAARAGHRRLRAAGCRTARRHAARDHPVAEVARGLRP